VTFTLAFDYGRNGGIINGTTQFVDAYLPRRLRRTLPQMNSERPAIHGQIFQPPVRSGGVIT